MSLIPLSFASRTVTNCCINRMDCCMSADRHQDLVCMKRRSKPSYSWLMNWKRLHAPTLSWRLSMAVWQHSSRPLRTWNYCSIITKRCCSFCICHWMCFSVLTLLTGWTGSASRLGKDSAAYPQKFCSSVDHATLILRLQKSYGLCDVSLKWITSYLSGRPNLCD